MLKKIVPVLFFMFSVTLGLSFFDAEALLAAPAPVKAPKRTIPAKDIQKMANLTGLSTSMLQQYDLDTAATLSVYAAAYCSGSDFDTVYKKSLNGTSLANFYQANAIPANIQANVTAKLAKLNAEYNKVSFKKDTYEGVSKNAASEAIAEAFHVSKSDVLEYGFGSGIPIAEILTCSAVAALTGNSLSAVIEKRKQGSSIEDVYLNYASTTAQRAKVTALVAKHSEEVNMASRSGGKRAKIEITKELKAEVEKLSSITGISQDKILDELKKGNTIADIKKAYTISRKVSADISNILKLKSESGWNKVYEYYGLYGAASQAELRAIEKELNDRITPPPQPIEKNSSK